MMFFQLYYSNYYFLNQPFLENEFVCEIYQNSFHRFHITVQDKFVFPIMDIQLFDDLIFHDGMLVQFLYIGDKLFFFEHFSYSKIDEKHDTYLDKHE